MFDRMRVCTVTQLMACGLHDGSGVRDRVVNGKLALCMLCDTPCAVLTACPAGQDHVQVSVILQAK